MLYLFVYEKFGMCDPTIRKHKNMFSDNGQSEKLFHLYGEPNPIEFQSEMGLRLFVKRHYPKQYQDLRMQK